MHIRRSGRVPGCSAVVWLMLLFLSPAANAQTTAEPVTAGPLIVEDTAGAVRVRHGDAWQPPVQGMTVELPAVVSTGDDGSVRLRQGETVITVASSTAIELYQGSAGRMLQRVVQSRGNAFYDIAPRKDNRLRVETPYLVAVIKGTEFNVSVSAESSTVALFEGRLQIEASDVGDVVDLFEGHIARRHRDDARITVIRMEDGEPMARHVTPGRWGGTPGGDSGISDGKGAGGFIDDLPGRASGDGTDIDLTVDGGLTVGDTDIDAGLDAGVDLGSGEVNLGADVDADLGDASVDAGLDASADLGGGEVDLGADVGADLGDVSIDTGIDAGADLGSGDIETGADLGADLRDAGVDVGLDAGGDLSGGDLTADLGGGVDVGDDTLDVDVGADADLGSGEAEVDVGTADVGLDLGLDAGGDLDSLLDVEPDLDPLDEAEEDSGEDEPAVPPILDLGNLFGR